MPLVGFMNSQSPVTYGHLAAAFRRGLSQVGFIEGRNVVVEYRWAEGHYERLPELAADLVRRRVAVLVARVASRQALPPRQRLRRFQSSLPLVAIR
jgi:putative ABC transport system substrate-binding protein